MSYNKHRCIYNDLSLVAISSLVEHHILHSEFNKTEPESEAISDAKKFNEIKIQACFQLMEETLDEALQQKQVSKSIHDLLVSDVSLSSRNAKGMEMTRKLIMDSINKQYSEDESMISDWWKFWK